MSKFLKFIKNNITLFGLSLIIVILLIQFMFFNVKINKMYHNINKSSSTNGETSGCSVNCNFEFIDFIKVIPIMIQQKNGMNIVKILMLKCIILQNWMKTE